MIPIGRFSVCKVDFKDKTEWKLAGGVNLLRPVTYEGHMEHTDPPEWGIIHALPVNYKGLLQVGDKVFGNFGTFQVKNIVGKLPPEKDAEGRETTYSLCMVEYEFIFFSERNGKIVTMNNCYICDYIEKDTVRDSGLLLIVNQKEVAGIGKVIITPSNSESVKEGDIIYHSPKADYDMDFEREIKTLDERVKGKKVFMIKDSERQMLANENSNTAYAL